MKIGILTFNFAINYGAVLQAWALQKNLSLAGHKVKILNYNPFPVRRFHLLRVLYSFLFRPIQRSFLLFRMLRLNETRRYASRTNIPGNDFDAYIVGSDQVWNIAYFRDSSGHYDQHYFLDFVEDGRRRISYAASVGEGDWKQYGAEIQRQLRRFDKISVRENFALETINGLSLCSRLVPDPTLLIDKRDWLRLAHSKGHGRVPERRIFVYGLSERNRCVELALELLRLHADARSEGVFLGEPILRVDAARFSVKRVSPSGWVRKIAEADFVITDSFHGVMLSLILNTEFAVVLKRKEHYANDRIQTILAKVGLLERIVSDFDDISEIFRKKTDWIAVNDALRDWQKVGVVFLKEALV